MAVRVKSAYLIMPAEESWHIGIRRRPGEESCTLKKLRARFCRESGLSV